MGLLPVMRQCRPGQPAIRRVRRTSALCAVWIVLLAAVETGTTPAADAARVDYRRDVQPILANHCWSCHGPSAPDREAGLRLDSFAGATTPTDSGALAVVPRKPDE